ncbi:hypothetical protein NP493_5663g00001 [Ridgeia piscesae]|uniref:Uncharacterized protein n=1 Tax=Ridgeia piscesae TaxID=27915 RepID=A0AAD9IUR6_RIDPI|nr:hypothetical protein NP493_5663g00001 [Ridgeia piscesae]
MARLPYCRDVTVGVSNFRVGAITNGAQPNAGKRCYAVSLEYSPQRRCEIVDVKANGVSSPGDDAHLSTDDDFWQHH